MAQFRPRFLVAVALLAALAFLSPQLFCLYVGLFAVAVGVMQVVHTARRRCPNTGREWEILYEKPRTAAQLADFRATKTK